MSVKFLGFGRNNQTMKFTAVLTEGLSDCPQYGALAMCLSKSQLG